MTNRRRPGCLASAALCVALIGLGGVACGARSGLESFAVDASPGHVRERFTSICVLGVGATHERFAPAALTVSTGALTYEANTVFLVADGVVSAVARRMVRNLRLRHPRVERVRDRRRDWRSAEA